MAMRSEAIRRREENERAAFSVVGSTGRSAMLGDALKIHDRTIARYRAMAEGAYPSHSLEQMIAWAAPFEGKRVLEVCCHDGEFGTILCKLGASVDSVDIAPPLIAQAHERAAVNGIKGKLRPQVMSVHAMEFPDASFDIVFGKAALHHLDIEAARDEIFRVLKPGGIAVFSDPVALSKTLRKIRMMVPVKPDAESPDERPLSTEDLENFCRPFATKKFAYFRLLSRLDRVVPSAAEHLVKLDSWILERVPRLNHYVGICAFAVTR